MSRLLILCAIALAFVLGLVSTGKNQHLVEGQQLRSLAKDSVPGVLYSSTTCDSNVAGSQVINCRMRVTYSSNPISDVTELAAYSDMCTQLSWDRCTDNTVITQATCSGNDCDYYITLTHPVKPAYSQYAVVLVRKEVRFHYRIVKQEFILATANATNLYPNSAGQIATGAAVGISVLLAMLL